MLGVTSSLGCATGQDDEPPDSSPQQRVGCTSADQSLDMRILASLYRTMIFPVALLSSVVDALQVTYRNTIRQAEKERERVEKRDGGATLKIRNESGTAVRHNCLDI